MQDIFVSITGAQVRYDEDDIAVLQNQGDFDWSGDLNSRMRYYVGLVFCFHIYYLFSKSRTGYAYSADGCFTAVSSHFVFQGQRCVDRLEHGSEEVMHSKPTESTPKKSKKPADIVWLICQFSRLSVCRRNIDID